jgi:small nuclear ribonucleoprotein (snRNP)-like protein
MTFVNELESLMNTEIAIIMNDGQAYRGVLAKFDDETMVLEKVYETSNDEIDWVEVNGKKGTPTNIKGYIPWRRVTLPKLIARNDMILRIWPWVVAKPAAPGPVKIKK